MTRVRTAVDENDTIELCMASRNSYIVLSHGRGNNEACVCRAPAGGMPELIHLNIVTGNYFMIL